MKKLISAAALIGTSAVAAPALAHVGEHSHAAPAHFLIEHGLAAGFIALALIIGAAYLLRKKS